jgi:hypothetical protein
VPLGGAEVDQSALGQQQQPPTVGEHVLVGLVTDLRVLRDRVVL